MRHRTQSAGVFDSFFGWYYVAPGRIDIWMTKKSNKSRYLPGLFVTHHLLLTS